MVSTQLKHKLRVSQEIKRDLIKWKASFPLTHKLSSNMSTQTIFELADKLGTIRAGIDDLEKWLDAFIEKARIPDAGGDEGGDSLQEWELPEGRFC